MGSSTSKYEMLYIDSIPPLLQEELALHGGIYQKLTDKQKIMVFARVYRTVDGIPYPKIACAAAAGYANPGNNANRSFESPKIKAAISQVERAMKSMERKIADGLELERAADQLGDEIDARTEIVESGAVQASELVLKDLLAQYARSKKLWSKPHISDEIKNDRLKRMDVLEPRLEQARANLAAEKKIAAADNLAKEEKRKQLERTGDFIREGAKYGREYAKATKASTHAEPMVLDAGAIRNKKYNQAYYERLKIDPDIIDPKTTANLVLRTVDTYTEDAHWPGFGLSRGNRGPGFYVGNRRAQLNEEQYRKKLLVERKEKLAQGMNPTTGY